MSILSKATSCTTIPNDNVFLIYGPPGSGKTTLASSFPKTKEKPMLYIDIMEGGAGVISVKDRELVQVVSVNNYKELDDIFTDIMNGYTVDDTGKKIPAVFSTIVIDSLTQMEFLMKEYIKKAANKDVMNLNLWGQAKDNNEYTFNMLRMLYNKTGSCIVSICHEKEMANEENPSFNKLIPSLMTASALSVCAKASYVFYCKIEEETLVDPKTNIGKTELKYMTYIDNHPYLLSKCRKPMDFKCPTKVQNLTYDMFKRNVLDKIV